MLIVLHAEGTAVGHALLDLLVPLLALIVGWLLKTLSDRRSQKREFDHRLRLEKEYGLCSDLWEKLFELRRSVGQLVESLSNTSAVRHDEKVPELFSACQATVRKSEPFLPHEVYDPARQIATLAREIISNHGKQEQIEDQRRNATGAANDEKLANKLIELDRKNDEKFKALEVLFQRVKQAIRDRVTPR
jgi:hypothetical protein